MLSLHSNFPVIGKTSRVIRFGKNLSPGSGRGLFFFLPSSSTESVKCQEASAAVDIFAVKASNHRCSHRRCSLSTSTNQNCPPLYSKIHHQKSPHARTSTVAPSPPQEKHHYDLHHQLSSTPSPLCLFLSVFLAHLKSNDVAELQSGFKLSPIIWQPNSRPSTPSLPLNYTIYQQLTIAMNNYFLSPRWLCFCRCRPIDWSMELVEALRN